MQKKTSTKREKFIQTIKKAVEKEAEEQITQHSNGGI